LANRFSNTLIQTAQSGIDYRVEDDGTGPVLKSWSHASPQPTQAQLDAVTDAQVAAFRAGVLRATAKTELSTVKAEAAFLRAVLLVVLDEFNTHTAKTNAILTAIDTSTNYATLKTNIGAIADLPVRTGTQLRTAVDNKIDTGDADT